MDSACIQACDIEKDSSQYDENLFANHVCSRLCSHLLWGALGMRCYASIFYIDFHHFCVSSPMAPVVGKTRGPFVKGRPWCPASSSALLCVGLGFGFGFGSSLMLRALSLGLGSAGQEQGGSYTVLVRTSAS